MEYEIAEASTAYGLKRKVDDLITRGFEPTGGMAIATSNNTLYYQAMIKRPTDAPEPRPTSYNCGVRNCGDGKCVHKLLAEDCPHCGKPLVEVTTNGQIFCSGNMNFCGYEQDPETGEQPCEK